MLRQKSCTLFLKTFGYFHLRKQLKHSSLLHGRDKRCINAVLMNLKEKIMRLNKASETANLLVKDEDGSLRFRAGRHDAV